MKNSLKLFLKLSFAAVSCATIAFTSTPQKAIADDTELFTRPPGFIQPAPNVLFILDNSSNWTANNQQWPGSDPQGVAELRAIADIMDMFAGQPVNVGLMMHTDTGTRGGYMRYGVRSVQDASNRTAFRNMINGIINGGNLNSQGENTNQANKDSSAAYYEAYLYFSGLKNYATPYQYSDYSGNNQSKTTFSNGLTTGFAYPSSTGGNYTSPLSTAVPCARNYIIYIGNAGNNIGATGSQTYSNGVTPISVGAKIDLPNNSAEDYWMDEWAKYLYQNGVVTPDAVTNGSVITYTIDVYNAAPNAEQTALLQSAARNGGGRYFQAANETAIKNAISEIFDEIQSVNSVFASVSLPVSVNVRGTNLNQVYLGMFRPDPQALPSWPGNLKQYQLALDVNENVYIADSTGSEALASTGFFKNGAVSFWTSSNTYWSFDPTGDITAPESDSPDGPLVERGGAAQSLRWNINGTNCEAASTSTDVNACKRLAASRTVYTYIGTPTSSTTLSGNASYVFNDANTAVTSTALGAANASERTNIINWIRGADLYDEDGRGDTTDMRQDAHGDVVHSRPAVINYNRYGDDNDVLVFYGANDGLLRAIQGGQSKNPGNSRPAGGAEYWSFAAPEFFDKYKRQFDNSPKVSWEAGGSTSFTNSAILVNGSAAAIISPAVTGINNGLLVSAPSGITAGTAVSGSSNAPTLKLTNNASSTSTQNLVASAGTVSATTTSGSNFASLTTIPAWLKAGMSISGTGVASGSTITGISASANISLTNAASATNTSGSMTFSLPTISNATRSNADNRIALFSNTTLPSGLTSGMSVSGTGIPAGATIAGTNTFTKATLNANHTVNGISDVFLVNAAASFTAPLSAAKTCAIGATCTDVRLKVGNSGNTPSVGQLLVQGTNRALITAVGAIANSGANKYYPLTLQSCTSNVAVCGNFTASTNFTTANVSIIGRSTATIFSAAGSSTIAILNSGSTPVAGQTIGNTTFSTTINAVSGTVPGLTLSTNATSTGTDTITASYTANNVGTTMGSTTATLGSATDAGILASIAQAGLTNVAISSAEFPGGTQLAATPGGLGITLSSNATASGTNTLTVTVPFSANLQTGNPYIQVASGDSTLLSAGMAITGTGIPASTNIDTNIGTATTVIFNANATVSGTQLVTFTNSGAGGQPKPYFFDGPIGVWRYDAPNTGTGSTASTGDGKITGACNISDSTDCDKVWIFVPMRRGGTSIYAFDVTLPATPKLMWKITGGSTLGFEELGETWSLPQPIKMNISGTDKPVLIFGGGYDSAVEDLDPIPASATRTQGRAIYFVDAKTGTPIKTFKGTGTQAFGVGAAGTMTSAQQTAAAGLTCSVASDAAVLNKAADTGFTVNAYRVYIPDTCGQLWRVDTGDQNPDNWIISRLASVGSKYYASAAGGSLTGDALARQSRKFLFGPDVVFGGKDAQGRSFDYVLIGSGDREHPFNGYGDALHPTSQAVENRFYMFKDYNTNAFYSAVDADTDGTADYPLTAPSAVNFNSGNQFAGGFPYTEPALYDATDNDIQLVSASTSEKDLAADALGTYHGWYIKLETGEKVVGGATSAAGSVFFGTNMPTPTAAVCTTNLGEARLYQINIKNAAAVPPDPYTFITSNTSRYSVIPGGGLPPTPVAVAVLIDGKFVEGVIAGTQLAQPEQSIIGSRVRVYSRKLVDRQ